MHISLVFDTDVGIKPIKVCIVQWIVYCSQYLDEVNIRVGGKVKCTDNKGPRLNRKPLKSKKGQRFGGENGLHHRIMRKRNREEVERNKSRGEYSAEYEMRTKSIRGINNKNQMEWNMQGKQKGAWVIQVAILQS